MNTFKTIFVIVAVVMINTTICIAVTRTVGNYPTLTIAQYSTIQSAINDSDPDDTILVNGSPNPYAGFNVDRRLVIIGPGWLPDKTPAFTAIISTGIAVSLVGASASGTEIQGLVFSHPIFIQSGSIDSIRIIRNRISHIEMYASLTTYSNYLFEGNIFAGSSAVEVNTSSIYQNFIFQNNYFYCTGGNSVNGFNQNLSTVLFDHNLWFGPGSSNVDCFASCSNLILTNNIFVRRYVNPSNSIFSNNITFNTGADSPWNILGNTDASGNIAGADPQMVSQAAVNSGTDNPINDFSIVSGSPAFGTGTGNTNMGLLYNSNGSLNWANSRNSRLPRIYSWTLSNPNITPGDSLNINVVGKKSN